MKAGRDPTAAGNPRAAMPATPTSFVEFTTDELRELLIAARSLIADRDHDRDPAAPKSPEASALESAAATLASALAARS